MWALITGASSGIGAEFTEQLARKRYDIILVARDHIRLQERARLLQEKYGVKSEIIIADLTTREGIQVASLAGLLAEHTAHQNPGSPYSLNTCQLISLQMAYISLRSHQALHIPNFINAGR